VTRVSGMFRGAGIRERDPGFRGARSGIPVTNLELHIQPIWSRYIHIPTGPFDADIVDDMNYL